MGWKTATLREALRQRLVLQALHHQEVDAGALEPLAQRGIGAEALWEDLDDNRAVQPRVACFVDFATGAPGGDWIAYGASVLPGVMSMISSAGDARALGTA